ncbi:MAG: glycosyltransferase [Eggerthellaceae bacterium]|jgi:glycosyltransferase involved in cell wall biosynthesis
MRVVQINIFPNLSTGSVMLENHKRYVADGHQSWRMWGRGRTAKNEYEYKFGTDLGVKLDVLQTRLDGKAGFHSVAATNRLIAKIDEIQPDLVHLHNLHGYYVNIEILFNWLAQHDCKVEWTLHDCWAFTGHCAHFTYVKCMQWKDCCACSKPCPQINTYPKTISKASVKWNFEQKKRLFTMLPADRLKLIAPSKWLADLTRESFLSKYPVEVRYNTIDTNVFKPTPSDFRERYGLQDKFIVLGVASTWNERKGIDDFVRLANDLDDRFAVVLVGLSEKQIKQMPERITSLPRTNTAQELAAIYSASNLLFNPTKEDNYPTVNLEAEACGTRVLCYDTGGCRETLHLPNSHIVPADAYDEAVTLVLGYL